MCSAPKMKLPEPVAPPPEQQAARDADINAVRKKPNAGGVAGGTLLTGGTGAAPSNVGGATLLGQ